MDNTTSLAIHRPKGPPVFDMKLWNALRDHYNCYAYALHLRDHGWAVPGMLVTGPAQYSSFTIEQMEERLKTDGLEQIPEHGADPAKDHIIAAFVRSAVNEFHFYCRAADGHWSHKQGKAGVRRLDDSFRAITDPRVTERQSDLRDHTEFAGFYRLPEQGIPYKVDADIALKARVLLHKQYGWRK
jgi:hypothetical protein